MKSRILSFAGTFSLLLAAALPASCGDDQEQHETTATGTGGAATVGAAAGGNGGDGTGAAPSWAAECEAVVDQNAQCGKSSDDQAALDECIGMEACNGPVYDPEAVHAIMACLATLPCSDPDDDCLAEVVSLPGNETQTAFVEDCKAKATECPDLAGDFCGMAVFFSDALVAAVEPCFDQPCSTAVSCALDELVDASSAAGCGGELPFGG